MARLLESGFESGALLSEGISSIVGTCTFTTTNVRSGARAGNANSGAGNATAYFVYPVASPTLSRAYHFRAAFRFNTLPTAGATSDIMKVSSTAAWLMMARLTSGGKLQLWDNNGGAQIGSDSAATLTTGVWYVVEMRIVAKAVGATDEATLWLDDVQVATSTTINMVDAPPNELMVGHTTAPGNNKQLQVDDVAINDDTGSAQTGRCGWTAKVLEFPTISDNNRGAWTGGSGGTTSLFEALNNTPPIGTATETNLTQIESAATSGTDNGDFNCTDYATAGIVSGDTINLVRVVAVHGEDSATNTKTGTIRVVSNPSGSASSSFNFGDDVGALGTFPTNWALKTGPPEYAPPVTLGTSAVARITKTSVGADVASCCYLAIRVEYTPSTAVNATGTATVGTASAAGGAHSATAGAVGTETVGTASAAGGSHTASAAVTATETVGTAAAAGGSHSASANVAATATAGSASAAGGSHTGSISYTGTTTVGTASAAGGSHSASASVAATETTGTAAASGGSHTASAAIVAAATAGTASADGGAHVASVSYAAVATVGTATATGGAHTANASTTGLATVGDAAASGGLQSASAAVVATAVAGTAAASGGTHTGTADVAGVDATGIATVGTAAASGGSHQATANATGLAITGEASAAGGTHTATAAIAATGNAIVGTAAASGNLQTASAGVSATASVGTASASGQPAVGSVGYDAQATTGTASAAGGLHTARADAIGQAIAGTATASGGVHTALVIIPAVADLDGRLDMDAIITGRLAMDTLTATILIGPVIRAKSGVLA